MPNQPLPNLAAPVTGNPLSQSYLTSQVYNPLSFLLNPPIVYATASSTQSLANGAFSLINIDTTVLDPYGGMSTSGHKWTVPVTGWYEVTGRVHFAGASGGQRGAWFTTDFSGFTQMTSLESWEQAGSGNVTVVCGGLVNLSQGTVIGLAAYQSSGGAVSTVSTSNVCAVMSLRFVHA